MSYIRRVSSLKLRRRRDVLVAELWNLCQDYDHTPSKVDPAHLKHVQRELYDVELELVKRAEREARRLEGLMGPKG